MRAISEQVRDLAEWKADKDDMDFDEALALFSGDMKYYEDYIEQDARKVADALRARLSGLRGPIEITLSVSPPSLDDAEGLAVDLGGTREVWRVVLDARDVVQTLDTARVKHYQTVHEAPVQEIALVSEARVARTKGVSDWNVFHWQKTEDDLLRMLYYTFQGYEGPHPWGMVARPPQPEYRPLRVVDPSAGLGKRRLIQKYLRHPVIQQRWKRILYDLRHLMKFVDRYEQKPKPKLKPKHWKDLQKKIPVKKLVR